MAEDPIIQRIESFRCRCGQLFAERRNRGYTLYRASSGALVARLRPTGQDDRVEVLYWSLWKERWTKAGPFGRTVLPLDQALKFIATQRTSSGLSNSGALSPKSKRRRASTLRDAMKIGPPVVLEGRWDDGRGVGI
jgi:hypothetical protein